MYNIIKQEGFDFSFDVSKCSTCEGNCCIGESGYIWCTPKEIDNMANFLGLERQDFVDTYTSKVGYRVSLKELNYNREFLKIDINKEASTITKLPSRLTTLEKLNIEDSVKTRTFILSGRMGSLKMFFSEVLASKLPRE